LEFQVRVQSLIGLELAQLPECGRRSVYRSAEPPSMPANLGARHGSPSESFDSPTKLSCFPPQPPGPSRGATSDGRQPSTDAFGNRSDLARNSAGRAHQALK